MNWLRLHVSNVCNFKCPSCHVFEMTENIHPSQLMNESIFVQSINTVENYLKNIGKKQLTISLYGGETLANKKVILNVLKNQKSYFFHEIERHWIINTNGSLLSEEDVLFFKEHNVEIHISVDGKEHTHNLSRTFHNGKATYQQVLKALKIIQQHELKSQINSYLMPTNLDALKEIVDIANEFDIKKIYLDQLYSENMFYDQSLLKRYQEIYFYSLTKKINLTGPWSRVKQNFNQYNNRSEEFLNELSIDVNVDGSFYSSSIPELKYSPLPQNELKDFLENNFNKLKSNQLLKYDLECSSCHLKKQCLGIAKEQVWYHINPNANTKSSCDFFIDWISYLENPLYFYQESKFDIFSLFPKLDIQPLINEINNLIDELEKNLWKLKNKFTLRIVQNEIELRYASNQHHLPHWAKSTTDKNTLYHLSATPCQGLKHEIVHLFLNQKDHDLPPWAVEGICEWLNNHTSQLQMMKPTDLHQLESSFAPTQTHQIPSEDLYYQSAKNFFCYIEKIQGREKMCQSLAIIDKPDLNQWLLSLNMSKIEETYSDFQKFVW